MADLWKAGLRVRISLLPPVKDYMIKKSLKHLFCNHKWELTRTIHGDEAMFTFKRSVYTCFKCNAVQYCKDYPDEIKLEKYLKRCEQVSRYKGIIGR